MNYAQKGNCQEFITEMGKAAGLFEMPELVANLQGAYDSSGPQGMLRQWTRNVEHLAATKKGYFPGVLAQAYAALGDKDRAFYWLEEYRQHHDLATADPTGTGAFKTNPSFAAIRSDPRFNEFLRRAGLPP